MPVKAPVVFPEGFVDVVRLIGGSGQSADEDLPFGIVDLILVFNSVGHAVKRNKN